MPKQTQLKGNNNVNIYPQTLVNLVFDEDKQVLGGLLLTKSNTDEYTPLSDYEPATKKYVDDKPRPEFITQIKKPTGQKVGDWWYQIEPVPYTWQDVNALNYTFGDVDALNIDWQEASKGGW